MTLRVTMRFYGTTREILTYSKVIISTWFIRGARSRHLISGLKCTLSPRISFLKKAIESTDSIITGL